MESSSEPILDVVRGMSIIASANILWSQAKNFYGDLFRSKCQRCRGAGTIICRHCHGTKICRTYPLKARGLNLIEDHPQLRYECFHCGPYAMNDFDYDKEEGDQEAFNIMDNLKCAMANKPRKHKHKPVAGTVPCPACYGQCVVYRHTPDFPTFFNLRGSWMDQIRAKQGTSSSDGSNMAFADEVLVGSPPQLPPLSKKLPNIRGLEDRSLDEVVLPYVDDSDTTESSGYESRDEVDDELS